jgi:hypothetical protein
VVWACPHWMEFFLILTFINLCLVVCWLWHFNFTVWYSALYSNVMLWVKKLVSFSFLSQSISYPSRLVMSIRPLHSFIQSLIHHITTIPKLNAAYCGNNKLVRSKILHTNTQHTFHCFTWANWCSQTINMQYDVSDVPVQKHIHKNVLKSVTISQTHM